LALKITDENGKCGAQKIGKIVTLAPLDFRVFEDATTLPTLERRRLLSLN
jgi:hypothetical protein